ncbi:MAG: hypothetical protein Q4B37_04920 [Eubacteriales bacterium]|nr:hypothetical protein [Eubacteriales bacterium]
MENVIVREGKIVLRVGGICALFFGIIYLAALFSAISDHSGAAVFVALSVFILPFVGLGLYVFLSYFRRRLEFSDKEFTVYSVLGKKKIYPYAEIRRLLFIERAGETRIAILGKEGERLASFEMNMSGAEEALLFLKEKGISLSEKDVVGEKSCDEKTRKALKWYEKSAYLTNWNREEEAERTKKVYTEEDVKRQQKRLKILGWILIAFVILVYFAGAKYMVAGWVIVLLFVWFLYIYLYPRAYIEKSGEKKNDAYTLVIPWGGAVLALLACLVVMDMFNVTDGELFTYAGIFGAVLLIPYFIKIFFFARESSKGRIIFVILAGLLIGFTLTLPVNYLLTTEKSNHVPMIVTGKRESSSSKGGTDYYISGNYQGENMDMSVSRSLFESVDEGSLVQICERESILGLEYWNVHE